MRTATHIMKLMITIFFIVGFTDPATKPVGKVSFILGNQTDVSILRSDSPHWSSVRLYSKLYNGDQVKTADESRCELSMNDQSMVRMGEKSQFTINQDAEKDMRKSSLSFGKVWLNIKKLTSKETFFVKTPTAVCSIRGTIFRVETDSSTRIAVYDGSVDVGPKGIEQQETTAPITPAPKSLQPYVVPGPYEIPPPFEVTLDQWIQIVKGYQIEIRNDGKYAKAKIDEDEDNKLDWVKWNKSRDELLE